MECGGSVYIMSNKYRTVLYIGVTSSLYNRIIQHKTHFFKGSFTDKYNVEYCMYYENLPTMFEALKREKEIKKWRRGKKVQLIESMNPEWKDFFDEISKW